MSHARAHPSCFVSMFEVVVAMTRDSRKRAGTTES
jgi:hypothetical protein